jgi:hypothetical protein
MARPNSRSGKLCYPLRRPGGGSYPVLSVAFWPAEKPTIWHYQLVGHLGIVTGHVSSYGGR